MAKTRRRYRRFRKANWASNYVELNYANVTINPDSTTKRFSNYWDLVINPVANALNPQNPITFNQKITVKNVEATFQLEDTSAENKMENLSYYIVYIPEGMSINDQLIYQHPEWIMAYKFIGSPDIESSGTAALNNTHLPQRVKTRLARNLNPGDRIILFLTGLSTVASTTDLHMGGVCRYWTKTN